jgi:hypothetical protein
VDIDLTLGHSGTYVIVLSNTFSPGAAKTVSGTLGLTWDLPLPILFAVAALALGFALSARRKRNENAGIGEPPQEELRKAA